MAKDDVSVETKLRLIRAALDVFAERGYRHATLREICRRAEANIAAVNYHFGDKEQLYSAMMDYAVAASEKRMPRAMDARSAPPEARLRQFVSDLMGGLLGAGRLDQVLKLMSKELVEPTPGLDRMVEKVVRPIDQMLARIVAELLDAAATPDLVRECTTSIMSQCVSYHHSEAVCERLFHLDLHDDATIEHLVDHIVKFSLGGIRAVSRGQAATRGQQDGNPTRTHRPMVSGRKSNS